jgi:catalase
MALEFRLPGGGLQHITMIDLPIFGAMSPASFRDAIVAAKPDPKTGKPDPENLKACAASHPDAMALSRYTSRHAPTANYYQSTYFSIHTFRFVDTKGMEHMVKWRLVPRDGTREMTAAELKAAPQQKGVACEPINFDPLVMADGIAPTNDPILLFRSPAYAVSFGKRLSGR